MINVFFYNQKVISKAKQTKHKAHNGDLSRL